MENRIEREVDAFWRLHQQDLDRNPDLANSRRFWRKEVELLDNILKDAQKLPDLNAFERASLATLKANREIFAQKTGSNYLMRGARLAAKSAGIGLHATSSILTGTQRMMAFAARSMPWPLALLVHALRIFPSAGDFALKNTGRLVDWLTNKLLPGQGRSFISRWIDKRRAVPNKPAAQRPPSVKKAKRSWGLGRNREKKTASQQPQRPPGVTPDAHRSRILPDDFQDGQSANRSQRIIGKAAPNPGGNNGDLVLPLRNDGPAQPPPRHTWHRVLMDPPRAESSPKLR
ncbi:hypothetical protein [Chitinophaga rhizosphaerae]|uniref:hypothetical protein n=1 Tax=Chitinophaga rhizosphaerae TaxID=1864947 RepID=UPI000F80829C|nr:hypothetical protein [Chitinophaga rhizosphaerae]